MRASSTRATWDAVHIDRIEHGPSRRNSVVFSLGSCDDPCGLRSRAAGGSGEDRGDLIGKARLTNAVV